MTEHFSFWCDQLPIRSIRTSRDKNHSIDACFTGCNLTVVGG